MRKALTVMAVVVLIAGCVSTKEYKARLSDIDSMRQNASELKTRISALEQENAALKNQLKTAQDEKGDVEARLREVGDEKATLEARLNIAENEKSVLEGRLNVAQNEKSVLETRLRTAKDENESLEALLKLAQDEKGDMEARLRKVEDEKAILEARLNIAENEKETLEARLTRAQDEKESLEAQLKIAQDKKAALDARLKSTEEAMAALQHENASLMSQISELGRQRDIALAIKEKALSDFKGTYDNLVKELKMEIESGQITINQLKDKLSLTMVDKVLFDSGSADIKRDGKKVLDRIGGILKQVTDKQINIEGHTDNVPISPKLQQKFPTNWELSTTRATNVVRYLQEKAGLDPQTLFASGSSEYRPVESNDTAEGRAKNRRIEIVLIPSELTKNSAISLLPL